MCVCVSCSHKFTQLGNYILQMAASWGERPNVTGGKYYCSADLCLKVLWVSVLWESCSPDLTRHDQPHQRLDPPHRTPSSVSYCVLTETYEYRKVPHTHLNVLCVCASKTSWTIGSSLRSEPPSVYLRRCETRVCFLKEQKSQRYLL